MNKVPIYFPRGFIGYGIPSTLSSGTDINDIITAAKNNRKVDTTPKYQPSSVVTALWGRYCSGTATSSQFAFREEVLITALDAFKIPNAIFINDWFMLQFKSQYFTTTHRRFLNDVFQFIVTGQHSVELRDWQRIISIQPAKNNAASVMSQNAEIEVSLIQTDKMTPVQFIAKWMSNDEGFDDLLRTLNILFGAVEGA